MGLNRPRFVFLVQRSFNFNRKMSIDIGGMRIKYKDKNETFLEQHLVAKEPFGQFKAWFEEACGRKEILEPNAMCLATATRDGYPSARFVLCKGYGKDGFKFFTNHLSRKAKEMLLLSDWVANLHTFTALIHFDIQAFSINDINTMFSFTMEKQGDVQHTKQIFILVGSENPNVAATFYWEILNRSVRIEGRIEKISEEESTNYFHSRPVPSQIAACASYQSTPIESRDILCEREALLEADYMIPGKEVPKPEFWGGYIIRPRAVEFWQGQRDRLHDRIKFRRPLEGEKVDGKLLHAGDEGWVYERLSP